MCAKYGQEISKTSHWFSSFLTNKLNEVHCQKQRQQKKTKTKTSVLVVRWTSVFSSHSGKYVINNCVPSPNYHYTSMNFGE